MASTSTHFGRLAATTVCLLFIFTSSAAGANRHRPTRQISFDQLKMQIASPRQIFLPPPAPPCRGNYVRMDGICRPVFGINLFPNMVFLDELPEPVSNDVVPVVDDADDGGGGGGQMYSRGGKGDSLFGVDRKLNPTTRGVRVAKHPTPAFVTVPRSADVINNGGGSGTGSGKCGPGMVLDGSGKCRRRFRVG